ncbi:MAG: GNAT family N-acetyltransferase [Sarcina sp.]
MKFRKATIKDIMRIMNIIDEAKKSLKNNNVDQWQNGYPNEETIEQDIKNQESYVMTDMDDEVLGTAMISFRGEPTYIDITQGKWLTNEAFCVIHRIAIKENLKGRNLARDMFNFIAELCNEKEIRSIKIDTHNDNKSMIKCLDKSGFVYCGIIYVCDGSQRVAFEKVLRKYI